MMDSESFMYVSLGANVVIIGLLIRIHLFNRYFASRVTDQTHDLHNWKHAFEFFRETRNRLDRIEDTLGSR